MHEAMEGSREGGMPGAGCRTLKRYDSKSSLYWTAELFCLTPNAVYSLGKLLMRMWVMHRVFFSCLLVFPIAIA